MLKRLASAVFWAVIAYLGCMFFGGVLMTVNVPIAIAIGSFAREFASLISVLTFLYFVVIGVAPLVP